MTSTPDTGILAQVPGACIAAGINGLPRPGSDGPQEMKVEVDAGWVGRVEITYRVYRHYYRKSLNIFWQAVHARPVDGGP